MAQTGLTQALTMSAIGLVTLAFDVLVLGQIVDLFVYYAGTWEIQNEYMAALMSQLMVFGNWFYYIILLSAILFIIYPFIFIFKRHRWVDQEEISMSEETNLG